MHHPFAATFAPPPPPYIVICLRLKYALIFKRLFSVTFNSKMFISEVKKRPYLPQIYAILKISRLRPYFPYLCSRFFINYKNNKTKHFGRFICLYITTLLNLIILLFIIVLFYSILILHYYYNTIITLYINDIIFYFLFRSCLLLPKTPNFTYFWNCIFYTYF